MNFEDMTKAEKELITFLETALVDFGGLICNAQMNNTDRQTIVDWGSVLR